MNICSKVVWVASFILIIAGGLVTSTGSGLSVPDWPLSYGRFFPPMIGGIRFEHTHRVIAAIVGLLTLGLTVTLVLYEKRPWVKKFGGVIFLTVLAQAILGGVTVRYFLPRPISVIHACLAQTFLALVAALVFFTSREWVSKPCVEAKKASSLQRLLIATTSFIYFQLIFGAMVRHGDKTDPIIRFHYLFAFLITLHVFLVLAKIANEENFKKYLLPQSIFLGFLVIVQIFLGFGAYIATRMIEAPAPTTLQVLLTTAHQALGALILSVCVLLTLRAIRFFRKPIPQALT